MWVNNKFVLLLYLHTTHYIGIPFFDRRTTELYICWNLSLIDCDCHWLHCMPAWVWTWARPRRGVQNNGSLCVHQSLERTDWIWHVSEYDINIVHVPPFLITSSSPGFVLAKYKMASNGSTHCPAWVVLLDRKGGTIEGEFYSRIFFLYLSPLC